MGNFLRTSSRKTTTLTFDEGGEIVVKTDISKGDFNALLARLPADMGDDASFTPLEADNFTTGVFDMLVVGWDATDPDTGESVPATVENYMLLPRDVAAVVDAKLLEYFNSLSVTDTEKKSSTKTSG